MITSFSCSNTTKLQKSKFVAGDGSEVFTKKLVLNKKFVKPSLAPAFKINAINMLADIVGIDVQFSGCGQTHDFELVSNGETDENGIVDIYLTDKTTGDNCRMMLMETKYFNITRFSNKKKINGFRINDGDLTKFLK